MHVGVLLEWLEWLEFALELMPRLRTVDIGQIGGFYPRCGDASMLLAWRGGPPAPSPLSQGPERLERTCFGRAPRRCRRCADARHLQRLEVGRVSEHWVHGG